MFIRKSCKSAMDCVALTYCQRMRVVCMLQPALDRLLSQRSPWVPLGTALETVSEVVAAQQN